MRRKIWWWASIGCALLFLGLTAAVLWIDVAPVGPMGSEIGLSSINGAARDSIGQNYGWYEVTEWLGYVALAFAGCLGLLGVYQLIRGKSFLAVDRDLYCVAGAYALVAVFYILFEIMVVNYRPVLMEGELEASFPSSHTMLVICLAGIAAHQLYRRISPRVGQWISVIVWIAIAVGTTVGRMLSGVHWLTDIFGGALLGMAILFAYFGSVHAVLKTKTTENSEA